MFLFFEKIIPIQLAITFILVNAQHDSTSNVLDKKIQSFNSIKPSQTRFQDDLIFLWNFLREAKKCPRKKKAKKIKIKFFQNTLF